MRLNERIKYLRERYKFKIWFIAYYLGISNSKYKEIESNDNLTYIDLGCDKLLSKLYKFYNIKDLSYNEIFRNNLYSKKAR